MEDFKGQTVSWRLREEVIELALHGLPANEMGRAMLCTEGLFSLPILDSADRAIKVSGNQTCHGGVE